MTDDEIYTGIEAQNDPDFASEAEVEAELTEEELFLRNQEKQFIKDREADN